MITEKMTKTRFTINVNFYDVINFILMIFGLGIYVAGFSKMIGVYKFSFLLCFWSFIFVSFYFLQMYFLMYVLPRWIDKLNGKEKK
ncbi:hypothetical protein [Bacillus pacificus]|uniref:hypothetical protein n=1 Tax=Bacillus pacificus TaxID=2026187 RepID=UPI0021D3D891|nr:hypothetical protein [Bacillus pacificus]MCU5732817.1 hypothetical protein [Bacillus pacificus]